MALNKYMHERNIYKHKKPDFKALADKYDFFRERVSHTDSGKVILDFKEPNAMRALTRALLADDFGLLIDLPLDRMIPMVPQRLNYILWLEDIVGQSKQVRGIDIGTGSSCIFPMIGCRQNNWRFLASDIDDQNIHFAKLNVEKNKMQENIKLKKVSKETLLCGLVEDGESYDFCMCNPPFYSDHLEAQGITTSRNDDRPEPNSFSTACENESIAWGGEVRFVQHMIEESLELKDKIRVYTSMLGKKSSIQLLKDELIKKQIPKFATTEFCQGRTMRWGIAWTFDETVIFPKSAFKAKKTVKPPLLYDIPRSAKVVKDYTVQAYTHFIKQELHELKVHYFMKHSGKFYSGLILKATENHWSHQRKKRRQKKHSGELETSPEKNKTDSQSGLVSNNSDGTSLDKSMSGESGNSTQEITHNTTPTEKKQDKEICDKNKEESNNDTKDEDEKKISKETKNSASDITNTAAEQEKTSTDIETQSSANCEKEQTEMDHTDSDINTEKNDQNASKKRDLEDDSDDKEKDEGNKRVKLDTDTNTGPIDLEALWQRARTMPPGVATGLPPIGNGNVMENAPEILNRSEVIKQFWKEQEGGKDQGTGKKSEFQSQEPFGEDEECLVMCKLELRKEDGEIKMTLTFVRGSREAMAQIQQYFKNKITTAICEYGKG